MKISIIVHGSPYSSQSAVSALAFAKATVEIGHEVLQVFFYHDGVFNSTTLSITPQDEQFPGLGWQQFSQQTGTKLVSCISSASRRGIHNKQEAARHELAASNCHESFAILGLGELVDATLSADRTITFGA